MLNNIDIVCSLFLSKIQVNLRRFHFNITFRSKNCPPRNVHIKKVSVFYVIIVGWEDRVEQSFLYNPENSPFYMGRMLFVP